MIIRHLAYLVALARERHFGRAAAACAVTQPTLSAGIRRLEEELGLPLVRRAQRFEGLTAEGDRVLVWAQRTLSDWEGIQLEARAMREGVRGRLRLGAIPTSLPSATLLTKPLADRHPEITVVVQSTSSRGIERGLHAFELDVGLTYLDNEPLEGVRSLPLYDERYVLLTPEDGPFAGRRTVGWAEAARAPLCLLTEDMQNRRIVNAVFREAGAEPRPTVETNSLSTLYAHVRDGGWSSVMAHTWLRLFTVPDGMRALPLVRPVARRSIGLVWLDRDPEPLLARALVSVAREVDAEAQLRTRSGSV